jgi:type II secretory ATPase GspE/PulE/Tfp pilus assembly ATPase PilB-like protein
MLTSLRQKSESVAGIAKEPMEHHATNQKVISSQAELDPKDHALPEMVDWCRKQRGIVVLRSGAVLFSSGSDARIVQNCKVVMAGKGLHPRQVLAATPAIIQILLANAANHQPHGEGVVVEQVSEQQKRLRLLVKEAVEEGASDIHIEVRPEVCRIRFRKHGELYVHAEWLPKLGREVASVAFNKETDHAITHFNPLVPQNASMPLYIEGKDVRLRLASMPAHGGFDVVMRLLAAGEDKIPSLEELGYFEDQVALIKKAIAMPHGAVIMSGPTGSGKTTTLASCMQLVEKHRKIYTIEDPVEKIVKTATQVPVNTEHEDRDFASMGRASLRMDPDVIVLGEMRDEETARVMVRASITGHLVFSTLHTNTAPGIITRLVDMGISPTLLSDPNLLVCLICQRLLPKLCKACAMPLAKATHYKPYMERWQKTFGDQIGQLQARGKGYCSKCNSSGVGGRTVVSEIIWVDDAGRGYIQKFDVLNWERYLKENGWQDYRVRAKSLVIAGICDPLDAERAVGEITGKITQVDYRTII